MIGRQATDEGRLRRALRRAGDETIPTVSAASCRRRYGKSSFATRLKVGEQGAYTVYRESAGLWTVGTITFLRYDGKSLLAWWLRAS
jgi:hypothetical protein